MLREYQALVMLARKRAAVSGSRAASAICLGPPERRAGWLRDAGALRKARVTYLEQVIGAFGPP